MKYELDIALAELNETAELLNEAVEAIIELRKEVFYQYQAKYQDRPNIIGDQVLAMSI